MAEAATRGALQGLREEEQAMQEGYELLDQKRILLVQEIKRQLADFDKEKQAFTGHYQEAITMLRQAVARHGLEGLAAYPPLTWQGEPRVRTHNLMGVLLQSIDFKIEADTLPSPDNPSPEADATGRLFKQLAAQAAHLAARQANLFRLLHEYRRTEHRARALEEVLLPELRQRIRTMTARIEDMDQEEALRVIGHRSDRQP